MKLEQLGEVEIGLDFEEGERRERNIVLTRMAMLDSVTVVGKRLARDEQMRVFEEHRKIGLGKFLTVEELQKARGLHLSSLMRQWPGIQFPRGDGNPVWVKNVSWRSYPTKTLRLTFAKGLRTGQKVVQKFIFRAHGYRPDVEVVTQTVYNPGRLSRLAR